MAVNLAAKFESKTSELLKARKKSTGFVNTDWSWDGVNAINVYTLTDPTMGNYTASGASRYGSPSEVEDTYQTWTLTRDRAWTKTIDKKNYADSMMVRKPGKYLAQATKNVLVPEIDTYVFQTIVTAAAVDNRDDICADSATTLSNAYTNFLSMTADIRDNEAPEEGMVCAMTAAYYNFVKQSGFVLASEKSQSGRQSGDLGTIDNVDIVIVPSSRMPTSCDCIIAHPSATVSPEKLVDYTLHTNAPGISGDLLEYRHRYDAFVDTNRTKCFGVHMTA